MGLAIVKKLIEVLGGRIWLESIPNKGTKFYFQLPNTRDLGALDDIA